MQTPLTDPGRVADAPSDNWVYRLLPRWCWPYAQLARWDRPIGWQLLMWPCWWSVMLAANAQVLTAPPHTGRIVLHLLLFTIGAIAMRGAGCTYNDLVDHEIDMQVARTRSRPLPSGRVSRTQAKVFMIVQALVGLIVLLQFNLFAIVLGICSLAVVAIYPFAKRFTDWPQFFLGLAFSWGALMGWAAAFGGLASAAVALYAGSVLWTIGYDTLYAHQDKEDDELIGVRSTARLFGGQTKAWLTGIYSATVVLMALSFWLAGASWPAFAGLAVAAAMLGRQIAVVDIDDGEQCLALFKSNNRVGWVVFAGLAAGVVVSLI
ncbi:4-hydroxybenzoate octaprenyltransferase [Hoeflea sp. TYP-13]|uniref:4-hydroxybenzoate octaprenyltransferase n=1 Tax=Hoeflea sp. TYP-13 TaxID=3230023 RepID=UPI0034C6571F